MQTAGYGAGHVCLMPSGSCFEPLATAVNDCLDGEMLRQLQQWRLPLREQVVLQPNRACAA